MIFDALGECLNPESRVRRTKIQNSVVRVSGMRIFGHICRTNVANISFKLNSKEAVVTRNGTKASKEKIWIVSISFIIIDFIEAKSDRIRKRTRK